MYGGRNMGIAKSYKDLNVYQKSYEVAMEIFDFSKKFPKDEMYSLTSQIRKSSRSVSANIAEAYRRRIYPKSFISKLNESEAEATETQNWLDYSYDCGYIKKETKERLYQTYNEILGMLVNMRLSADKWKP
jgi:four helix bundle protein